MKKKSNQWSNMPTDSVDILENTIRRHKDLLDILLTDQTKKKSGNKKCNIIWATDSYKGYKPTSEIHPEDITGDYSLRIQPRISKTKAEQQHRTKEKAEVFTPDSIVDEMNKQVDWNGENWPVDSKNWQEYIKELKLEITCGEAPFIVNRYNAANGRKVRDIKNRVGFLDRKLQVVSRYCNDKANWFFWTKEAFKASYGYEWQGDNLLLARENLLYTFIDYWNDKFPSDKINLERKVSEEKIEILREIATIISWNIFQMDGLKYIIPMSNKTKEVPKEVPPMFALFGGEYKEIAKKVEESKGKSVYIMDWEKDKAIKFSSLIK